MSDTELCTVIEPAREVFLAHQNEALSAASLRLYDDGYEEAAHMPAVKYALDATFDLLDQPDIAAELPREVYERQAVASMTAQRIAELETSAGVIMAFYVSDPHLNRPAIKDYIDTDESYLGVLSGAPFSDVRLIAGGAFKLLKMSSDLGERPADIIKRSHDLLAVSRIFKGHARQAELVLGRPYARINNFWGKKTDQGMVITLDRSTKDILSRLSTGMGCPAGRVAITGASGPTLLHQYWDRIVDYLITDDATVEPGLAR